MKTKFTYCLSAVLMGLTQLQAQIVEVDINPTLRHEVGGVSDFGRERHITVHAAVNENDWLGEEEKMKYLLEDLDVYLGRDNGRSTFLFQQTPMDPDQPNRPHIDSMKIQSQFWNSEFEKFPSYALKYEDRAKEMIMGTNPHPTYPTLSWYDNGLTTINPKWQPKNVETSAEWVTEYLDNYFAKNPGEDGPQLPKYWEVINEPDMLMMTGQFMVTSQEKLWEYHNLVAEGVKRRLGSKAPLIGGMTWGLHDFFRPDGLGRFDVGYLDVYLDAENQAIHRAMSKTAFASQRNNEWYQWDVMWKGFIDAAGANMDFYAVHIYDWPLWETTGGAIRSGAHTEAMLDMMEWYDVQKFGKRKPIVISEYGAVTEEFRTKTNLDPARRDWENLKPFSQMMMQFLERPDYIVKSMPFTPIKAEWGDYRDANGTVTSRYPYTMMDQDASGDWQWSDFIKWYELWAEVDGTRIDTYANDLDFQVDAYVNGNKLHLILNSLEQDDRTLKLNFFNAPQEASSVRIKHLHLKGDRPALDVSTTNTIPNTVTLGAEATMILTYTFPSDLVITEVSKERKYYGESLNGSNGSTPHRVTLNSSKLAVNINGVQVPEKGEAQLRLCGAYFYTHVTNPDPRNVVTINGFPLEFSGDWRGEENGRNIYFGVLEIPIPVEYLRENNVIESTLLNVSTYTNVDLKVWDMSMEPGRTEATGETTIAVTGLTLTPTSNIIIEKGDTTQLSAKVVPENATNTAVTWSSSDVNIASVDSNGLVIGRNSGTALVTATSVDGAFTASVTVSVNDAVVPPPAPVSGLVIQAEDFMTTGGTFQGFQKYTVNGIEAINYNQTGDWADYEVSIPESGTYQVIFYLGTAVTGAALDFIVDGVSQFKDPITNTNTWDVFTPHTGSRSVVLSAGIHTIRLLGAGTNGWEWNMDRFVLSKVGAKEEAIIDDSVIQLLPNPVVSGFTLVDIPERVNVVKVKIYDISGAKIKEIPYTHNQEIPISQLATGLYFVQLVSESGTLFRMKMIKE